MRVLHVLAALDGGGVEMLLYNYYSRMDKESVHFDFIVYDSNIGILEESFVQMGCKIYHIIPKKENIKQSIVQTIEVIKKGNYDVVHCHAGATGIFAMYFAKRCGVNTRILHNHIAFEPEKLTQELKRKIISFGAKRYSTHWFACGVDAGKWFFGEKAYKKGKIHIMNNAINISQFTYSKEKRDKMRRLLNVKDKFVIGNVARFSYQKNHEFLIQVFAEIYKKNTNAVLLLVGRGDLEGEVKKQVIDLGLDDVVKFLGVRNDVSDLLQAMDVFILTSRFEGLPVTLVETQAAGLPSFASDSITKEIKITDLLEYISLKSSPEEWANKVLDYVDKYSSKDFREQLKDAGYDINTEAEKLEQFYLSCTR